MAAKCCLRVGSELDKRLWVGEWIFIWKLRGKKVAEWTFWAGRSGEKSGTGAANGRRISAPRTKVFGESPHIGVSFPTSQWPVRLHWHSYSNQGVAHRPDITRSPAEDTAQYSTAKKSCRSGFRVGRGTMHPVLFSTPEQQIEN